MWWKCGYKGKFGLTTVEFDPKDKYYKPAGFGNLPKAHYEYTEFGCQKVQLFKPYLNCEMIEKAHQHGIRCNVFLSDDPKESKEFLEMGIDTILSNDYNLVSQSIKR